MYLEGRTPGLRKSMYLCMGEVGPFGRMVYEEMARIDSISSELNGEPGLYLMRLRRYDRGCNGARSTAPSAPGTSHRHDVGVGRRGQREERTTSPVLPHELFEGSALGQGGGGRRNGSPTPRSPGVGLSRSSTTLYPTMSRNPRRKRTAPPSHHRHRLSTIIPRIGRSRSRGNREKRIIWKAGSTRSWKTSRSQRKVKIPPKIGRQSAPRTFSRRP